MNQKLWEPHLTGATAVEKLLAVKGLHTYTQLHSWSIENPGEFWSQAWNDVEIIGSKGSASVAVFCASGLGVVEKSVFVIISHIYYCYY